MKQWVIKKKSCLATYTVERKNVFKTLSEQSKLEKAEASLKNTKRKDWNWKHIYLDYHFWGYA